MSVSVGGPSCHARPPSRSRVVPAIRPSVGANRDRRRAHGCRTWAAPGPPCRRRSAKRGQQNAYRNDDVGEEFGGLECSLGLITETPNNGVRFVPAAGPVVRPSSVSMLDPFRIYWCRPRPHDSSRGWNARGRVLREERRWPAPARNKRRGHHGAAWQMKRTGCRWLPCNAGRGHGPAGRQASGRDYPRSPPANPYVVGRVLTVEATSAPGLRWAAERVTVPQLSRLSVQALEYQTGYLRSSDHANDDPDDSMVIDPT